MKRFWESATAAREGAGWQVLLDGRPVRLPDGPPLRLPGRPLAEAVAAEWSAAGGAKGGEMSFADVPLTRLAGTAQARIGQASEAVALELARYGESDLLCYRATHPPALRAEEDARWQPWLDWAARRHGARLRIAEGIVHVPQDPASLAALAAAVAAQDVPTLAALGVAIPVLGSLVLGLALADGALDAAEAFDLSVLDDLHQEAQWGQDEAALARRTLLRADLLLAGRFLDLSRAEDVSQDGAAG